jgi:hypothetical protein
LYDPAAKTSGYSYSSAFLINDKNNNGIQDESKEPVFPRAASPKSCIGGVCTDDPNSTDPRLGRSSGNKQIYNFDVLIAMTALIMFFHNK